MDAALCLFNDGVGIIEARGKGERGGPGPDVKVHALLL